MKLHNIILSAAAALLGFAACSKDEMNAPEQPQDKAAETLVPVTLGANFAATKTTMASDGDILWTAGDSIQVVVGSNNYWFTLISGEKTTSGTFSALVTASDASIISGATEGTVYAYYPKSCFEVPTNQSYVDTSFATKTFPMTATKKSGSTLEFTTNAAVVRVQNVSATATKAVLSYTVSSTNYNVTMDLTAGDTAKDLYFVVVPGAQKFNLSIDKADAVEYSASAATAAGSRYNLTAPVAQIGDVKYATLAEAVTAATSAGEQTTITMIANYNVGEFTGNKIVIPSSADIILDLNGKTISGTGNGGIASYLFWNSGTLKIVDTAEDGTITYSSTTPDGSYHYGTSTLLNRGILEVASGHIVNTTSGGASYAVDNQTLWWDDMTTVTFTLSGTANIECTTGDAGLRQSIGCGTEYKKEGQDIINNVNINGGTVTGDIWIQRCNIDPFGNLSITAGTITGKVYDANSSATATNVTYAVSGGTLGSISLAKTNFITGGTFSTKPDDTYVAAGYTAKAQGTDPETWKVVSSQKEVTPETVQDALDNAEDGTIIILGAGDYPTLYLRNNGTASNRIFKDITIKAATGAVVTVDQIKYEIKSGKTLDIENLTIDRINFDDPHNSAFLCDVDGGHSLRVNGLKIQNCTKTGDYTQSAEPAYNHCAFIDLCYDAIETAIDTKFAGDETLTCGYHNIVVQNNTITSVYQPIKVPNNGPLYDMTITGNTFDDCLDNHMMLSSKTSGTVTITDNTIKNMTGRFARISGAQSGAQFVISGNTVTTPKKYDTGGDGSIFKITGTNFTVTDENNGWNAGAFESGNATWIAYGTTDKLPVAQNGDSYYYGDNALASAVSSAKSGSVKTVTILKTGDYTLPNVEGLTIQAETGVTPTFTIASKGQGYSIAGANGSTLKGLKFILPTDSYIGFYEADVTFDNCTFENLLTTYCRSDKQIFNYCSFKSTGNRYGVWAYGPCDFNNCKFDTDEGKAIYLYAEALDKGYVVNFDGCSFTNTGASCRKPAILIKTRAGGLYTNGYKTIITNCTATGFTNFNSKGDDVYDYAADGLWGIETKSGDDLTYTATYLTVDGTQVYPGFYPDADDANLHHVINAKGLKMFRDAVNGGNTYVGKTIKLEADIDLASVENWDPIGLVGTPFNGTFDGQNHTISNLKINRNNHAGLFGYCINHGYIENVTVDKAIITTNHYAGAILAQGYADLLNCHVKNSSITCAPEEVSTGIWDNGDKAGALAGQIQEGSYKIHNCSATYCTVKGYRDVGGLVGYKYSGADYKNNTVTGKVGEVTVTVDNTHNYEEYTTNAQYHANAIVGECNGELDASNTSKDVSFSYPNNEN